MMQAEARWERDICDYEEDRGSCRYHSISR